MKKKGIIFVDNVSEQDTDYEVKIINKIQLDMLERLLNPHVDQVLCWDDPLVEDSWKESAERLALSGKYIIINI